MQVLQALFIHSLLDALRIGAEPMENELLVCQRTVDLLPEKIPANASAECTEQKPGYGIAHGEVSDPDSQEGEKHNGYFYRTAWCSLFFRAGGMRVLIVMMFSLFGSWHFLFSIYENPWIHRAIFEPG